MKVTILTHGTRGDVQPFVALALALREGGHDPLIAGPENFADFVSSVDVPFMGMAGNTHQLMSTPEAAKHLSNGDVKKFFALYADAIAVHASAIEQTSLSACGQADVILAGVNSFEEGFTIAEKLRKPLILVSLCPGLPPTGEFPNPWIGVRIFPLGFLNRLTYAMYDRLHWASFEPGVNDFRKRLGLEKLGRPIMREIVRRNTPIIHGFSPSICKIPKDWSGENRVTGFIPTHERMREVTDPPPPPELQRWLDSRGKKPLFFGFGSMPMNDTERTLRLISEVTAEFDVPVVVATGWSAPAASPLPSHVYTLKNVSFDWLFPRCSTVVHQGGAGTTHTGLRAGVPTFICSFAADQHYWGARVKAIGAGSTVRFRDLDAPKLREGLRKCLSQDVQSRAEAIGAAIRAEGDGAKNAVRYIEEVCARFQA